MTYRVLAEIRARTKKGEAVLLPGQVITFDASKAERLVKEGKLMSISLDIMKEDISRPLWSNPHPQGSPAARKASLMAIMESVWTSKFQGIISKVLNGKAKLADFRQAVEAWERIITENFSKD